MTLGPTEGVGAAVEPASPDPSPCSEEPRAQESTQSAVVHSTLLSDAIGGPRGMIDTGIPAIIFVIVNAASSLTPAIYAALGAGVVLVAIRLICKQTIQQALAGFVGIGIAAFVASRTHSAEGFFLPGILYQGALAIAAAVSLVIRRPLIGYAMAALDPRLTDWRRKPKLLRAMDLATVVWGSVFLLRAVVQGLLYLAHHAGWLAVVQIAMGWPLFAAALATSYALARRAAPTAPVTRTASESVPESVPESASTEPASE